MSDAPKKKPLSDVLQLITRQKKHWKMWAIVVVFLSDRSLGVFDELFSQFLASKVTAGVEQQQVLVICDESNVMGVCLRVQQSPEAGEVLCLQTIGDQLVLYNGCYKPN